MGLTQDRIVIQNGQVGLVPSGSIATGSVAANSVAQVYAISMSGASATSSHLAPAGQTGSFFSITQPDNFTLKVFFQTSDNASIENTGSSGFPQSSFISTSGSAVPVIFTHISSSEEVVIQEDSEEPVSTVIVPAGPGFISGSDLLTATYNALNTTVLLNTRFSFSASYSPDVLFITNEITGAPPANDIIIDVSGSSFTNVITTSGSGALRGIQTEGNAVFESGSLFIQLDPLDRTSAIITGSGDNSLYFSGSGDIGLNTDDPQSSFDAIVSTAQFQRPGARKGLKINQDGNIESFDKDPDTASTGSEFLLRFSRGTAVTKASLEAIGLGPFADDAAALAFFNGLRSAEQNSILEKIEIVGFIDPPQIGDTLGSIRWVAESGSVSGYDDRTTGETAVIKAVVSDGASDGISADLIFSVAGKTGAAEQKFLSDANNSHQLVGVLNITGSINLTTGQKINLNNGEIRHATENNTRIDINTNDIKIGAQHSSEILKIQQAAFTVNPNNNNFQDFFVRGNADNNLIATDASTDKVGIGTASPGEKLEVVGNISASGNIIGTVDGGTF